MPRDTRLQPPTIEYAPPAPGGAACAWRVRLGGATLDITPHRPGARIALALGIDDAHPHMSGHAPASDTRGWCNALAMLTDARLSIQPADEVELRSPMLVVDGIGYMALWRWLGSDASAMRLLVAPSPEELIAGEETTILFVSADEVRALVAALAAAGAVALGAPAE